MIDQAVKFQANSLKIIQEWNSRPKIDKSADYWLEEIVTPIRAEAKAHYRDKQNFECAYCRQNIKVVHGMVWDVEHIIPRKLRPDFMFEPQNLCIVCKDCNGAKGDTQVLKTPKRKYYPVNGKTFLIYHPHFERYSDHIEIWINKIYVPKSEKGIKTIEVCGLLRFSLGNLGWDPIVGQKAKLVELASKLQSATTEIEKTLILSQMLLLAQIGISRELA